MQRTKCIWPTLGPHSCFLLAQYKPSSTAWICPIYTTVRCYFHICTYSAANTENILVVSQYQGKTAGLCPDVEGYEPDSSQGPWHTLGQKIHFDIWANIRPLCGYGRKQHSPLESLRTFTMGRKWRISMVYNESSGLNVNVSCDTIEGHATQLLGPVKKTQSHYLSVEDHFQLTMYLKIRGYCFLVPLII